jgi:hypothetical protein
LSYIIALIFLLTVAGSTDSDMRGIGTFSYCGTTVVMPVPEMKPRLTERRLTESLTDDSNVILRPLPGPIDIPVSRPLH